MRDYPIAIVDLETTGLDYHMHEIIEIGLVLVDQNTLEIKDTMDVKVRPLHIERASPKAMEVNGYNENDWADAWDLKKSMITLSAKSKGAIFGSQNVTFDWGFCQEGFYQTNVNNLMDYHRIDLFTMSWMALRNSGLDKFNLYAVSQFLGLEPEPLPHCAFNGALNAYEVFKKLVTMNTPTWVIPSGTSFDLSGESNFAGSVMPLQKAK